MQAKKITGKNPLAYLGVDAVTPPQFIIEERDPTDNDYSGYDLGTLWLCTSVIKLWMLTNKDRDPAVTKWVQIYPADGSGTNFFETNSGIASENAGTINIKGSVGGILTYMSILDEVSLKLDEDLVITNSLKVASFTEGILRSNATGQFSSLPDGTGGQVLISSSSGLPIWANLTAGANVTITNGDNSILIAATGGGGGGGLTALITDSGTASIDGSNQITMSGSTNIETSGAVSTATLTLKDEIVLTTNGSLSIGTPKLQAPQESLFWGNAQTPGINIEEDCIAIGHYSQTANESSHENISIGTDALKRLVSGDGLNLAIGVNNGVTGTSFERNIFLGNYCGCLSTGDNNILVGTEVESAIASVDNEIRIGNDTHEKCYLGGIYNGSDLGSSNGVVLIDSTNKLVKSKGTLGQVLTSTATGVGWATGGGEGVTLGFNATVENYDNHSPYLGVDKAFTEIFDYGNNFFPGDGVSSRAVYTASTSGLYVFRMGVNRYVPLPFGIELSFITTTRTYATTVFMSNLANYAASEELIYLNSGDTVSFEMGGSTYPIVKVALFGGCISSGGGSVGGNKIGFYATMDDDVPFIYSTDINLGEASAFTEVFDYGNCFFPGNGTGSKCLFTASHAGLYRFTETVSPDFGLYGSRGSDFRIVTTSRTYHGRSQTASATGSYGAIQSSYSQLVDLAAGDTVYFQWGMEDLNGNLQKTYTTLQGELVCES